MTPPPLILASASPRRLMLLEQIGVLPNLVVPAEIDETPHKAETPHDSTARVAREKAEQVALTYPDALILAADTVVACGRRILPKAEDEATARQCLTLLSGRRHRVLTAIALTYQGSASTRLVTTMVRFRRLSASDIAGYLATGEWEGKAGGYAIQGAAQAFIPAINGSYSSVVGLPLAEVQVMLAVHGIGRHQTTERPAA